jgi:hypothetical protein
MTQADHHEKCCTKCGHGWFWHSDYDDALERYVGHGCDHWTGCDCKAFDERTHDSSHISPLPFGEPIP